jgi:hypothetical protein
MSFELNLGTEPKGIRVNTFHGIHEVFLGNEEILMEDFLLMVEHVMESTDLLPGDPRKVLLTSMKGASYTQGFNGEKYERICLGEVPKTIWDKMNLDVPPVPIKNYRISMQDFCYMVGYVLGNTDLVPGDPRKEFLGRMKSAKYTQGHLKNTERIFIKD